MYSLLVLLGSIEDNYDKKRVLVFMYILEKNEKNILGSTRYSM